MFTSEIITDQVQNLINRAARVLDYENEENTIKRFQFIIQEENLLNADATLIVCAAKLLRKYRQNAQQST